ncbi:MAG: hypothetical protein AMXMBFR66_02520 [Pseudomonadota bacterium]|nr:trypsin-like serine protease [Rubrivivax sp.]
MSSTITSPARAVRTLGAVALAAMLAAAAVQAEAAGTMTASLPVWAPSALSPLTSNLTDPPNWRLDPGASFNGVANAFDGTALLLFKIDSDPGGTYACSGSLMQGGEYVLTAGHCVTDMTSMQVNFGWYNGAALQTRTVTAVHTAPGWVDFNTNADQGNDLALVKLDQKVSGLHTYALSTTNDVGKTHLMTGYGTVGTGGSSSDPDWSDWKYGHYGWNVADVTSKDFNKAAGDHIGPGWGYDAAYYTGTTYMSDFDNPSNPNNNTLGRLGSLLGGSWTSNNGVAGEALIAGGDSGGGDFIWDGSQWVLSAVHSWGWGGACEDYFGLAGCDASASNSSSFGDLSGSTAVFSHVGWIQSVTGVPEPATPIMLALGLLGVGSAARWRRAASASQRAA